MKFVCKNKDCENYEKEITISPVTYRMLDNKLVANEGFCSLCKEEMEELKIDGDFNSMVGTPLGSPTKNWTKQWGNKKSIY